MNQDQTPLQPQTPQQPQPANTASKVRTGWILFGLSIAATLIGWYFGIAIAASAILASLAGRLGLEAKNKALSITAFIYGGLMLIIYIYLVVISA